MYERIVKPAPPKAVIDGKFMFGTYNTPFTDANLIEAPHPFTREVSPQEKYLRLHQWEAFQIGDGRFFVMAAISPQAGLAELMVYDKQNKKEYSKRNVDGPAAARRSANNLLNSEIQYTGSDGCRYEISNTLEADGKISFSLKSTDLNFYFEGDFTDREPIVTLQPFSENRPFYSHKALAPGTGYVEIDGIKTAFDDQAFMIVDDHQGYYPHRSWYDWVTCAEYQHGKLTGLQLTTNQMMDPLYNNENCVWYDGKMYPLPNVSFYRSRDRSKTWLIRDDLGMVDLTFEPTSYDVGMQLRFETAGKYLDFYAPFGYMSGTVTTAAGLKVQFDRIYCVGESKDGQYLPDEADIDN